MRDRRTCIALLVAALVAGPAAAEVRSPRIADEVRALNDAARQAVSQKDYGAALTAYRRAIIVLQDEPDALAERTTAMLLVAVCLEKLDRPAEALVAHREAIDAGLAEPLAGKARERLASLRAQVEASTPAAEPAPTEPPTQAGTSARASTDPEAALAALNERAKAAVDAKRWDVALEAYRDAVRRLQAMPGRQGELAMTWFLVGVCLDELGRRDEADAVYARARSLGPQPAILDRITERIGPPPGEARGVPVELACAPGDLVISVGELLDGASCDALRSLPPGSWRIEARGADGRRGSRTMHVHPGQGAYRISLVVPPILETPPPEIDRRAAWVLTVGALATAGVGGALVALDGADDLGSEARPVGLGLLALGGALAIAAGITFATADTPRLPATPPGWGPVGWTF